MVVDDSIVVRGQVRHWIESHPGLELAASLRDGRFAVEQVLEVNPDVVVLDIEMPGLDGVSALPLLLEKIPDLAVIIASSLTPRNAEVTLKVLSLGALDCIAKPDPSIPDSLATFRRDLLTKIVELGKIKKRRRGESGPRPRPAPKPVMRRVVRSARPEPQAHADGDGAIRLRPFPTMPPRVLVIGASTGGPQALGQLLSGLTAVSDRAPILVTQHMPATFTTILAEHLGRAIGRPVREGGEGDPVRAGTVYLAPGGRHMRVARRDGNAVIALDDGPPIHHCKPAVDPLFSSAAQTFGAWVLGVVLTGMGVDGRSGAADIVEAGGAVIAQDEDSSVVWGMPGAVAEAQLCSAVLDIRAIAPKVTQLFNGERP
jgi:two-component system chemotaxis response regulator CheB